MKVFTTFTKQNPGTKKSIEVNQKLLNRLVEIEPSLYDHEVGEALAVKKV